MNRSRLPENPAGGHESAVDSVPDGTRNAQHDASNPALDGHPDTLGHIGLGALGSIVIQAAVVQE
jgi:hypothetical protein